MINQFCFPVIHGFYSINYAGRRAYSDEIATNIYAGPMAFNWNW